jgi:hypothetical protein
MTPPELVAEPEAITPEWLTQALAYAGHHGEVRHVETNVIGTGQVGRNVRLSLTFTNSSDAPASLVAKLPAADAVSRQTGIDQLNYLREVRFYSELAPTVDIRTPRVLFTDIDESSHDFIILMEDLSPAEQGDQLAGCGPDSAHLALLELAKLHAPRWGDELLADHDWLMHRTEESAELGAAMFVQLFPGFVDRYREQLSPAHLAVAELLGENFSTWSAMRDEPFAITHGDYRLDNMLFGLNGQPYPLTVVDWQTAGYGPPVADAAYFLGAGLLPEDRKLYEKPLMKHYYAALEDGGVEGYSWQRCWDDYRRFSFSGLVMAVVASMIVGQSERGDAMFMAMASRHAQQAIDLGAKEFLGVRK